MEELGAGIIICHRLPQKTCLSIHNGFESVPERIWDGFRILDHSDLGGVNPFSVGNDLEEEMRSG